MATLADIEKQQSARPSGRTLLDVEQEQRPRTLLDVEREVSLQSGAIPPRATGAPDDRGLYPAGTPGVPLGRTSGRLLDLPPAKDEFQVDNPFTTGGPADPQDPSAVPRPGSDFGTFEAIGRGIKGVGKGIKEAFQEDPVGLTPFVGGAKRFFDLDAVRTAAERIQDPSIYQRIQGNPSLTPDKEAKAQFSKDLKEFGQTEARRRFNEKRQKQVAAEDVRTIQAFIERMAKLEELPVSQKIGRGVAELPAFITEFITGGVLATPLREVVEKGLSESGKKWLKSKITRGVAKEAVAVPHRFAVGEGRGLESVARRRVPGIGFDEESGKFFFKNPTESSLTSFVKGHGDWLIEVVSESVGPALVAPAKPLFKWAGKGISKAGFEDFVKLIQKGTKASEAFRRVTGVGGFVEENLEEFLGMGLRHITGIQDASLTGEELLVQMGVLAIPQIGRGVITGAQAATERAGERGAEQRQAEDEELQALGESVGRQADMISQAESVQISRDEKRLQELADLVADPAEAERAARQEAARFRDPSKLHDFQIESLAAIHAEEDAKAEIDARSDTIGAAVLREQRHKKLAEQGFDIEGVDRRIYQAAYARYLGRTEPRKERLRRIAQAHIRMADEQGRRRAAEVAAQAISAPSGAESEVTDETTTAPVPGVAAQETGRAGIPPRPAQTTAVAAPPESLRSEEQIRRARQTVLGTPEPPAAAGEEPTSRRAATPEAPPASQVPEALTAEQQREALTQRFQVLTVQDVKRQFPQGRVETIGAVENPGFAVTLPNKKRLLINNVSEITASEAELLAAGQRPQAGQRILGKFQSGNWRITDELTGTSVDIQGVIELAEGRGDDTFSHETFHAAWEMALTENDHKVLEAVYGSEEAAADAYGKWHAGELEAQRGRNAVQAIFARIRDFFRRLLDLVTPRSQGAIFRDVESGRAFRGGQKAGRGVQQFQMRKEDGEGRKKDQPEPQRPAPGASGGSGEKPPKFQLSQRKPSQRFTDLWRRIFGSNARLIGLEQTRDSQAKLFFRDLRDAATAPELHQGGKVTPEQSAKMLMRIDAAERAYYAGKFDQAMRMSESALQDIHDRATLQFGPEYLRDLQERIEDEKGRPKFQLSEDEQGRLQGDFRSKKGMEGQDEVTGQPQKPQGEFQPDPDIPADKQPLVPIQEKFKPKNPFETYWYEEGRRIGRKPFTETAEKQRKLARQRGGDALEAYERGLKAGKREAEAADPVGWVGGVKDTVQDPYADEKARKQDERDEQRIREVMTREVDQWAPDDAGRAGFLTKMAKALRLSNFWRWLLGAGVSPDRLIIVNERWSRSQGEAMHAAIVRMTHAPESGRLRWGLNTIEGVAELAGVTFDELQRRIGKLSAEQQQDIYLMRGKPVTPAGKVFQREAFGRATDEMRQYAEALDEIYDANYQVMRELDLDALYFDDYFYGAYKNAAQAEVKMGQFFKTTQRFLKEKKLPTVADALAFGLVLRDQNPVDNAARELRAILHLAAMRRLKDELTATAYGTAVVNLPDATDQMNRDWKVIFDTGGEKVGGKFISNAEPTFRGLLVHPDVARMVNNMIAVNKTSHGVARVFRNIVHTLNPLKFLLPFFHLRTILAQAAVDSGVGGVFLPWKWFKRYKHIGQVIQDTAGRKDYLKYIELGGGHHFSVEEQGRQAWDRFVKASFDFGPHPAARVAQGTVKFFQFTARGVTSPFRALQSLTFETVIPAIKYAKYLEEKAKLEAAEGREATDEELIKIIKVGQNFYGEMNERLFGRSGTAISLLRFAFLAPGFREGNYRTMQRAGAMVLGGKEGPRGRDWRSFLNIPQFLLFSGILATIGTRIMTGAWPDWPDDEQDEGDEPEDKLRDLFKIKTNFRDWKGRPVYIDLMTTDRDYYEQLLVPMIQLTTGRPGEAAQTAAKELVTTIGGMKSSMVGLTKDALTIVSNETLVDWKGDQVYYITDPPLQKLAKIVGQLYSRIEPIPASVMRNSIDRNVEPMVSFITAVAGVRTGISEGERKKGELWRKFYAFRDQKDELLKVIRQEKIKPSQVIDYNRRIDAILAHPLVKSDEGLTRALTNTKLKPLDYYAESRIIETYQDMLSSFADLYLSGDQQQALNLVREYKREHPNTAITADTLRNRLRYEQRNRNLTPQQKEDRRIPKALRPAIQQRRNERTAP